MLIPDYWAEAAVTERVNGKQISIRRFGWSEQCQEDAQLHASTRANEALTRVLAGEPLARREPKVAYNGAVGVPIREEVLSRHQDAVITRNLYGARCLNTPNVLFADIDFQIHAMPSALIWTSIVFAITVFIFQKSYLGWWQACALAFCMWYISYKVMAWFWFNNMDTIQSKEEQRALSRVDSFIDKHPDWHLRVYRTPAGLRLLAMHQTFGADDSGVEDFFREIEADTIYVQMCRNQHCFRARVSPKPWRIGIESHLKPRPGVWPINPARLPDRIRWVNEYEFKAQSYASCRFMMRKGGGRIDSTVEAVRELHDDLCRAHSDLPLA